jgi:ribosomal protein S18 acetylase RimI-like enzyme
MEKLEFRPASRKDAKIASRLLFESFPEKATFIIGLGSEERAKRILEKIFEIPGHRLSYTCTELATRNGQIVGVLTSFPGKMIRKLDRNLTKHILRQYRWRGKLAVIIRGYPLLFIKETMKDEYFLSNLVVKKRLRGNGLGAQLLAYIEDKTQKEQLGKVALMVNISNQRARQFYLKNGYKMHAMHLESNKRVPYLGAGYQRMVKQLEFPEG